MAAFEATMLGTLVRIATGKTTDRRAIAQVRSTTSGFEPGEAPNTVKA